jgi:hypothetical protein
MAYPALSVFLTFALCYFFSRAALRMAVFPGSSKGLYLAHLASATALLLLVVLIKFWTPGFSNLAVVKIAACQLLCLGYDKLRDRRPGQTLN